MRTTFFLLYACLLLALFLAICMAAAAISFLPLVGAVLLVAVVCATIIYD